MHMIEVVEYYYCTVCMLSYHQVTRVQSTDQTTSAIVYADVSSTLSRNPTTNANISLQLDDDCVQYADLKQHHQQTPELHQKASESNSHSGTVSLTSFPAPPSTV